MLFGCESAFKGNRASLRDHGAYYYSIKVKISRGQIICTALACTDQESKEHRKRAVLCHRNVQASVVQTGKNKDPSVAVGGHR